MQHLTKQRLPGLHLGATPGDLDVDCHNSVIQTHRLFQFLMALDEKYDTVKRDILNTKPLPKAIAEYAIVRQDKTNDQIIKATENEEKEVPQGIRSGLAVGSDSNGLLEETATALAARDRGRQNLEVRNHGGRHFEENKLCSKCGERRHIRESCFQLIGYLECWDELTKKKAQNPYRNRAAPMGGNNRLSHAAKACGEDSATRHHDGHADSWMSAAGGRRNERGNGGCRSETLPHSLKLQSDPPNF